MTETTMNQTEMMTKIIESAFDHIEKARREGFESGRKRGFDEGYDSGYSEGFEMGNSATYD